MMHRATVPALTALALCLGLAGCSSGSASGVAAASAGQTGPTTPTVATSATGPSSSTPSAPSPLPTTTAAAVASGSCSMIDRSTAATILGFTTQPGLSSSVGGTGEMKKLDGCTYQNLAAGSLGYDVTQVDATIGAAMVGAAKARMTTAGAQVSPFDPGIANSAGFTQKLPLGVDSQIWVMAGDHLIAVAATRKDGDVAKSRAAAIAATQRLVAGS